MVAQTRPASRKFPAFPPPITQRQKQILELLQDFQARHGFLPSMEELARESGLSSVSGAHHHFHQLEKLGYLVRKRRGVRFVGQFPWEQWKGWEERYRGLCEVLEGWGESGFLEPQLMEAIRPLLLTEGERAR